MLAKLHETNSFFCCCDDALLPEEEEEQSEHKMSSIVAVLQNVDNYFSVMSLWIFRERAAKKLVLLV